MAVRTVEEFSQIPGSEKAAMLMLALGEDSTARLFALMDDDEIREISQTMANLGIVRSDLVERVFVEFLQHISSMGSLSGTYESTERLLGKVLGDERVNIIMEEIRRPAGRTMWDKLSNVNESVLANYLKNEYPQTVAVVLSKVKVEHAARALTQLPEAFAMEVVMRLLRMEAVQKEVLDDVERTLRNEFMSNLARTARRDVHELMADIFNNLDRNTEARFVTALEERNREAAEKVKALMFTFEDLARLDPSSVQTLLRGIQKEKLAVALKDGSEPMRELFFGNMSERAAKILKEDMETLGPVRLRAVDEAQMELVKTAKDLASRGEIIITDSKSDDELVCEDAHRCRNP